MSDIKMNPMPYLMQPDIDNDILTCSICGKHYQQRHMWIGPDKRCIICFKRYRGYPRYNLNIKKTYNFIKIYLIEHYYIKDENNHFDKYHIGCTNPDKLDDIVYGFDNVSVLSESLSSPSMRAVVGWGSVIILIVLLIYLVILIIWLLRQVL